MGDDEGFSEVSSTSSHLYFQRRYDGKFTRREALEKIGKNHKVNRCVAMSDNEIEPMGSHGDGSRKLLQTQDEHKQAPHRKINPRHEKHEMDIRSESSKVIDAPQGPDYCVDDYDVAGEPRIPCGPQHLQDEKTEYYYRISYRGVVALLSGPTERSTKSGAYVGYGEIIASRKKMNIGGLPPAASPLRQTIPFCSESDLGPHSAPKSKLTKHCTDEDGGGVAVRVDRVLTGGYAFDGYFSRIDLEDKTPRRNNAPPHVSFVGSSPLPLGANFRMDQTERNGEASTDDEFYGYILSKRRKTPLLVPLETVPNCLSGSFLYRVVSSTPVPISAGPCTDAPKTRGVLLPGTIHEVSLRVSIGERAGCFLKLAKRRGWVMDRKIELNGNVRDYYLMQDLSAEGTTRTPLPSVNTSIRFNSGLVVNRKHHRPPRRMRKQINNPASFCKKPKNNPGQIDASNCSDSTMNQSNDKVVLSPSSNISLLSDDSSFDNNQSTRNEALTPDRSIARSTASSTVSHPTYFLMRVNAPRGLAILDAPHFQVNHLIRGHHHGSSHAHSPKGFKDYHSQPGNQSIFQTMSGNHTTTLTSRISSPAVFDSISKTRKLPRGSLFEASKRIETPDSFHRGAGLIKLSDDSGWAIVPRQEDLDGQYRSNFGALGGIKEGEATRAYEEVGNAVADDSNTPVHCRIISRGGVIVSLPPASVAPSDGSTSPTSSAAEYSSVETSSQMHGKDSEVASSVGSSFLDAMFRTPSKKIMEHHERRKDTVLKGPLEDRVSSPIIPCGMFVEVDRWIDPLDGTQHARRIDYVRLRGGQGWLPKYVDGRQTMEMISAPVSRIGSFWFRVEHTGGIKVRTGPSKRAPSIKSDEGAYFRFECGEFLRASETVTFFQRGDLGESFAKLYRNRHVRFQKIHDEVRSISSLTSPAEWVQISENGRFYLEECSNEPRIERNKRQGWRYNVVLDARVNVRKGPSFSSETNGVVLLGGESVLVNERVVAPNDKICWLRLKDGQGWVHNIGLDGDVLMIPHSLRHRKGGLGATNEELGVQEDLPYNTIIARLFHGDISDRAGKPGAP